MSNIVINISSKRYHGSEFSIFENFKLSLQAGEFVCLLGPSGCGKTTLLNCIAGLDKQYEGEVILNNHQTQPKIAYVFQNPRLLPWRTVRENIELVLDKPYSVDHVDSLLATMQLDQVQQVYPERLSLGMSRRVAIIRAFAVNPDILLMDEPFVSLDAPTARDVRELLLNLWLQRPRTVLFVTHDLREAISIADRLVFLSASPMQIVHEIKIPIARDQRDDEQQIESFRLELKHDYPTIKALL